LVKVEATPINPSDLGLLLGPADMSAAKASGVGERCRHRARALMPTGIAWSRRAAMNGSACSGTLAVILMIKASSSEAAQALLGKTVSMIGGAMYAQYRLLKVTDCQPLPADTTRRPRACGSSIR
jgi:hypothetical protein